MTASHDGSMDKPYTTAEAFTALRRDVFALGAEMSRAFGWRNAHVALTEKRNEAEAARRQMRRDVEKSLGSDTDGEP